MALLELFNGLVPSSVLSLWEPYDPRDDDIVQTLRRSLDRYLADNVDPAVLDKEKAIPAEVLRDIGELGAFGLAIPEDYGGAGLNMEGFCHVLRTVAARDSSVGATVGAADAIGTHGIKLFGTDEQRERFLPRVSLNSIRSESRKRLHYRRIEVISLKKLSGPRAISDSSDP